MLEECSQRNTYVNGTYFLTPILPGANYQLRDCQELVVHPHQVKHFPVQTT